MHVATYIYRLLIAVNLHHCKIQPCEVVPAVEYIIYRAVKERGQMKKLIEETVEGWHETEDKEKVVVVVDKACESAGIRRVVEKLNRRRYA